MSNAASGLAHLKPFLPGLEPLLEDAEVSEIMINGPGNVWIEAGGRLTAHAAPGLTNRPCYGRLFTSPDLWAWTRPPRPSSTPGSMMVPAWRSVSPRPVPRCDHHPALWQADLQRSGSSRAESPTGKRLGSGGAGLDDEEKYGSSGKWGGGDVVGTFRIPNLLPVRLSI